MTMTFKKQLLIFAGALAAASAAACSDHEAVRGSAEEPVHVRTATVSTAEVADTFEAGGVVQARTTATVTARILAPIREVRVKPGDKVRAGQVLVVLDGADLGAHARSARAAAASADESIASATADQQAAEAALTLARAAHARIASLHAKRSATAQELDEATAGLRRAEAAAAGAAARARGAGSGLESARAAADAAATTASFATIVAPFAGIVTEKLVEPGNMAAPGSPLIRIEDTRGFRLEVRVDESRASDVVAGTGVRVALDSGTELDGRVAEISRAVDADTRAFLIKIDLPDTGGLRSGQFGRAFFPAKPRRGITVPEAALTRRGQVTSVFVVENGVARLRLLNVRGTEVLAGLADGDVVIVDPPPGLTDGRRVTSGGQR
jgi:multidrug efflux pump subunit AcrA (membrane-fusion protein)